MFGEKCSLFEVILQIKYSVGDKSVEKQTHVLCVPEKDIINYAVQKRGLLNTEKATAAFVRLKVDQVLFGITKHTQPHIAAIRVLSIKRTYPDVQLVRKELL